MNLFDVISDFGALLKAFYRARRGKSLKVKVCEFEFFLEKNILQLRYLLKSGSYIPSPYTHFIVFDPKMRQVSAPVFRDRVVQHSLVAVIEPLFEKKFIFDSYACRREKGTHFGAKRVKKFLMAVRSLYGEKSDVYILQSDVRKYFQSISWDILLSLIGKTIQCKETINLIEKIITTHEENGTKEEKEKNGKQLSLFVEKKEEVPAVSVALRKGLPIGNLTSQLFANIYLNELDHFIKEELKERWYGRYMDDFFIIHPDKEHLREAKEKIRLFLDEKLGLELHPKKTMIQHIKNGVPFVGYRIFFDHILVRGGTLLRMQKKYRKKVILLKEGIIKQEKFQETRASIGGHFKHADAHRLYNLSFGSK